MRIDYPQEVHYILQKLEAHGYQGYLVGGCVRDQLLHRAVNDYDVTTNALPHHVQTLFSELPQFHAGIKHGTVSLIKGDYCVEVTTYRSDGVYDDYRRPTSITFSSHLKDDLSRRDFTINALAYSEREGLVDCFDGVQDLENGIIRAIGNPQMRFTEDGLRIMRGVRFASQLSFSIEEKTHQSMIECRHLLQHISGERKATELILALLGDGILSSLLQNTLVYSQLLPELERMDGFEQNNPHHQYDVLHHTAHVIDHSPMDRECRLAALFHDVGKVHCYTENEGVGHFYGHGKISEEIARHVMNQLKMDNETIHNVCKLVQYHDLPIENTTRSIRRSLNKLGEPLFFKLLDLKKADALSQAPICFPRGEEMDNIRKTAFEFLSQQPAFSVKSLAVNGHDMMALGLSGASIGQALNAVLEQVLEEKVNNTKEELIMLVKELYDK